MFTIVKIRMNTKTFIEALHLQNLACTEHIEFTVKKLQIAVSKMSVSALRMCGVLYVLALPYVFTYINAQPQYFTVPLQRHLLHKW